MNVDISKVQPGDVLLVRVTVTRADDFGFYINHSGSTGGYILAEEVAGHVPILKAGDRVRNTRCSAFPPNYEGGVIMAVSDGWALVRFSETPGVAALADLERVEASKAESL